MKLNPLNDLAFLVTIKVTDDGGSSTPLAANATGTAFLATSNASTATAADATLVVAPLYTGKPGRFLVRFDATLLTSTLLATLFAAETPWCIVTFPGDIRVAVELMYEDALVVAVGVV